MSIFSLDFETTSACDISRGAYRYASCSSTQILLFAIAVDDEAPKVWRYDEPESPESQRAFQMLQAAVLSGHPIRAFNVGFEAAICKYVLKRQLSIDPPVLDQWRCTQFLCRRSGAPPSLAKAAEFLKLGDQKNPVGKALIGVFSDQNKLVDLLPPRPDGMTEKDWKKLKRTSASPILETPVPWDWTMNVAGDRMTVREAWNQFITYCRQDVVVEREVARKLAKMEPSDEVLAGFHFDLKMNARGVPVDLPTLEKAQKLILAYEADLVGRFEQITGLRPSQTAKVLAWLRERGYKGSSLNAATVAEVKAKHYDKLSEEGRTALDIRVSLSFAAVKKVPAMMEWVCPDGRIRGAFTFYGAQKTGRWTSQGPQFQNMKKPGKKIKKLIPYIYDLLAAGELDNELVEILFGNPYEIYASLSRYFVRIPGRQIYDVDFAQVEARILPALIGCERILDKFRNGEDIYMDVAKALGVDRDMGKVISLLCIAEGEQVLTDRGLVPIEKVSRCHRVWDGVAWVHHDGVICKGIQETITYQGLRATPNHEVYCRDATGQLRTIPLGVAAQQQADLVVTERCGETVRSLHGDERHTSSMPEGLREGAGSVRLRNFSFRGPELIASGSEPRMPGVSGRADQVGVSSLASQQSGSTAATMPEPGRSRLQDLRGPGDRVSLPEHRSSLPLDHGKLRASEGSHAGSDRQLRALRGGQPAVGDLLGAVEQYPEIPTQEGLRSERVALQPDQGDPVSSRRNDAGTNHSKGAPSRCREAKELAGYSGKARVYDIVNAGPRHRFTVSGKLVSNCQFQGGWRAVKVPLGDRITEADARKAVSVYRQENPEVVEAWRTFQDTWVKAIREPGRWHKATEKVAFAYSLKDPFPRMLMRLPAGRNIVYPYPKARPITMVRYARTKVLKPGDKRPKELENVEGYIVLENVEEKSEWERLEGHLSPEQVAAYVGLGGDSFPWQRITGHFHTHELEFWGHVENNQWGTVKTYGGDLLQSCLGGTTAVLTIDGFKFITQITKHDLIWDGEGFVRCDGVIYKGHKPCIVGEGFSATPDHEFMVDNSWVKRYKLTHDEIASQGEKLTRNALREFDGHGASATRAKDALEFAVRLRDAETNGRDRDPQELSTAEENGLLENLPVQRNAGAEVPRLEQTCDLRGPRLDDVPVLPSGERELPPLRSARNPGMQAVAPQGELLCGHAGDLRAWQGLGSHQRPQELLESELPLGDSEGERTQQGGDDLHGDPVGSDESHRSGGAIRDQLHDVALPQESGSSRLGDVPKAGFPQPVYDLLNCGPRNRFAIWTHQGLMLAHNCTQGTGMDFLLHGCVEAEKRGHEPFFVVHDQALGHHAEGRTLEDFINALCTRPAWFPDFPLDADGSMADSYQKD